MNHPAPPAFPGEPERKTLKQIDDLTNEAAERLSPHVGQRLAQLRNIIVAGAPLTTAERAEVAELWGRHVPVSVS